MMTCLLAPTAPLAKRGLILQTRSGHLAGLASHVLGSLWAWPATFWARSESTEQKRLSFRRRRRGQLGGWAVRGQPPPPRVGGDSTRAVAPSRAARLTRCSMAASIRCTEPTSSARKPITCMASITAW